MQNKHFIDDSFFRSRYIRLIIFSVMVMAFFFGYTDIIFGINFERLHIFFFNLTTGGSIILYYTEGGKLPSIRVVLFFALSIAYALSAFLEVYLVSVFISLSMFIISESVRIKIFSLLPSDFLKSRVPMTLKFHQASILCLSMALLFSSLVILNNEYFHWVYFRKLQLNVFFLGFSFPVSLITLSVIFKFIQLNNIKTIPVIENISFWTINLGVMLFFMFIIFEIYAAEIFIAVSLFAAVFITFFYFLRFGLQTQQKYFLISGMSFLLSTAITGILYIIVKKIAGTDYDLSGKLILRMHAFLSLYGWNLSGLMVIMRWHDFPLKLNTAYAIFFHWIIILVFATLGKLSVIFSMISIISFVVFLIFFISGRNGSKTSV